MCISTMHNISQFMDINPLWEKMKETPFFILDTNNRIKQKLYLSNKHLGNVNSILTVFDGHKCLGFITADGDLTDNPKDACYFDPNMCIKITNPKFNDYHVELRDRISLCYQLKAA